MAPSVPSGHSSEDPVAPRPTTGSRESGAPGGTSPVHGRLSALVVACAQNGTKPCVDVRDVALAHILASAPCHPVSPPFTPLSTVGAVPLGGSHLPGPRLGCSKRARCSRLPACVPAYLRARPPARPLARPPAH